MWNSILQSAASALERTGDVITERATSAAKKGHEQQVRAKESADSTATASSSTTTTTMTTSSDAPTTSIGPTIARIPPPPSKDVSPSGVSPEYLRGGADMQLLQQEEERGPPNVGWQLARLRDSVAKFGNDKDKQQEVIKGFQLGWGSVVEATKHAVEATKVVVEKEQARLEATFRRGPYKRDPKLPLDVDALRDAEVVYITDRLITMGHPAMQSATDGDITPDRKLAAIGHLLQRRHEGKYMVWNLSEMEYDYSILDDQVLTYQFPGSPSPPLGMLLKLLLSIESWLKADERNVAVLHCLTGRGRTSTVLAAFLCWTGEAGFHDPTEALEYIACCKRLDMETLTIPSQRRYASYFANMLDGVRPSQPPLFLKRIIMSEAPKFGKCPKNDRRSNPGGGEHEMGCAPYLQIFKAGQLVFTTAAAMSFSQGKDDLPFCVPSDGPISFPIELVVQGDILIRCRHLSRRGQRVSMFRAAFHTGYVPPKVLRLSKAQLDGACSDKRFENDFFLDFIFEACGAEMASKHLLSSPTEDDEEKADLSSSDTRKGNNHNEAADRREKGTIKGVQTASAYDTMLHRDSRFWDVISDRRKENMSKLASSTEGETENSTSKGNQNSAFFGPTIGRRRDFSTSPKKKAGAKDETGLKEANTDDRSEKQGRPGIEQDDSKRKSIEAFSIGGEFDFLVDEESGEMGADKAGLNAAAAVAELSGVIEEPPSPPRKRDELMEALMELDDDDVSPASDRKAIGDGNDTEEIVFDGESDEKVGENTMMSKASGDGDQTDPVHFNETAEKSAGEGVVGVSSKEGDATSGSAQEAGTNQAVGSKAEIGSASGINALEGMDNLDLEDDEDNFPTAESGDGAYEFEDDLDDDDDLEDLENFLTQASGK